MFLIKYSLLETLRDFSNIFNSILNYFENKESHKIEFKPVVNAREGKYTYLYSLNKAMHY